jgi:tetratricopeptide (TPR) repeat protein
VSLLTCSEAISRNIRLPKLPGIPSLEVTQRPAAPSPADLADRDPMLAQLNERIQQDPRDINSRLEMGRRFDALGLWDRAIQHYQVAALLAPTGGPLMLQVALSYRKHGQAAEAASTMAKFVKGEPSAGTEYWSWAGILSDEAGQYTEAEEFHRQALSRAVEPTAYLLNNLGHNLLLQGRRNDAVFEFRRALALDPGLDVVRNNLAVALSDPRESIVFLQAQSDPATTHSNNAAMLIEQGRYLDARKELRIALSHKPDHSAALRNLSILSSLDGKAPAVDLISKDKLGDIQSPAQLDSPTLSNPNANPQEQ